MKKLIPGVLAVALAATVLGSCGEKKNKSAVQEEKVYKIGVVQLVEHPALDAAYKGFVDGLESAGLKNGKEIIIDYQNAQNEQANCVTIAQKLVSSRSDLILAIATPAAQAVANQTESIPILVTAVTDPETANLVKSNKAPGTNVSGTSDLTPCAAQIDLLKQIVPDVKTVGMLFCSSEANSRFQIDLAEAQCQKVGLDYVEATVSNTNEVQQVVKSLIGKVDAIYTPTDNMIASCMATVSMEATAAKIPVICGEDGMVQGGGLATFGINYYELGKQTANMAVEILKNGANPAEMPIQYLENCDFSYNPEIAEELGIQIPANLLNK